MDSRLRLTDVRLIPASTDERQRGLLGFVAFNLNDRVRLDGATLRRTSSGRLRISFPMRRDRHGREHPLLRPLADAARRELERQVLAALGLTQGSNPGNASSLEHPPAGGGAPKQPQPLLRPKPCTLR